MPNHLFSYYQHKFSYWSKRGVKGPKAFPILGTLLAESNLPANELEKKFYKDYGHVFGTYYNTRPVNAFDKLEFRSLTL